MEGDALVCHYLLQKQSSGIARLEAARGQHPDGVCLEFGIDASPDDSILHAPQYSYILTVLVGSYRARPSIRVSYNWLKLQHIPTEILSRTEPEGRSHHRETSYLPLRHMRRRPPRIALRGSRLRRLANRAP